MKRRILVLTHTGRAEAVNAAVEVICLLDRAGVQPVVLTPDLADLPADLPVRGTDDPVQDVELVVVLGGDGTILRAASLVRGSSVPLLGVNLGHVGFLAESERDDLEGTVARVVAADYEVEERMTLDVLVWAHDQMVARTWAINEASVEKASRERMLEMLIEVDGRPVTSFGADGVVMSTPTGSTAYAFSAGGPVIWPEVAALALVPISAHALFARPLVVTPTSTLAVELMTRTEARGVLWCDGRRTVDLPPGARVEVRRSAVPVKLARLRRASFTDRLVGKFQLPVHGWRGPESRPGTGPLADVPAPAGSTRTTEVRSDPAIDHPGPGRERSPW